MMIPFSGLGREYQEYKEEYQSIFNDVMTHAKVLQGSEVEILEQNIANKVGRKYAVAVGSATDSLYYSLLSCGIKSGDEVLVSSFSFIASVSCIVRVGATPVFCDIDDNYHMTLKSIKKMVSEKTKAVIYPHMFGNMSDINDIVEYCKLNNFIFIEDSAQSLGSKYKSTKAGSVGECSNLSFGPGKTLGAPSTGGIFLTDDIDKSNIVKMLRYHGKNRDGDFERLGFNSQMSSLSAKMLNFKLSQSDQWEVKRQNIAYEYNSYFTDYPLIFQKKDNIVNHIFHKYVLRFESNKKRDEVFLSLKENDIQSMIHYNKPLYENKLFNEIEFKRDETSNVKKICNSILSLPIHPWLKEKEIKKVINIVRNNFT